MLAKAIDIILLWNYFALPSFEYTKQLCCDKCFVAGNAVKVYT